VSGHHHEVQIALVLLLRKVLRKREQAQCAVLLGHIRAVSMCVHDEAAFAVVA
jgi:hypothetical protein